MKTTHELSLLRAVDELCSQTQPETEPAADPSDIPIMPRAPPSSFTTRPCHGMDALEAGAAGTARSLGNSQGSVPGHKGPRGVKGNSSVWEGNKRGP